MISLLNLVLFGLFFIISWKLFNRKSQGEYPKGPLALPFLGNVLSFGKLPYLTFNTWANQYGKIYQVWIGNQRHIVISELELIKKAFQHLSFAGRPKMEAFALEGSHHGILFTAGQEWQEQRRFTLRHLRDFGFGKNVMEALIREEIDELLDSFKSQGGKPFSINRKFTLAVINSLWRIITGKRLSQTDPKLEAILEELFSSSKDVNVMVLLFMPGLAKMFPNLSGWNKSQDMMRSSQELVTEAINEHRAEFSAELQEEPRDFVDAYLGEINKTTDTQSSFYGTFGAKSLKAVAVDLFQAGSLTTSTTLTWAVLYMVNHLESQKRFQKEIDEVIGKIRPPSLTDRPQMVYTEALICEILRKSSLVPNSVFHTANEDTSFEGYDVPKGSNIVANLIFVHHDPKIWGDPENFRPERFISAEGKIQKKEYLVPFSTGKRICIGETLARDELFLFLTSLYQRFEIRADPSRPVPTIQPVQLFGILDVQEYFITLQDRVD